MAPFVHLGIMGKLCIGTRVGKAPAGTLHATSSPASFSHDRVLMNGDHRVLSIMTMSPSPSLGSHFQSGAPPI